MSNESTTGTTLAILAPYLPYGIEVQYDTENDCPTKGRLHRLDYDDCASAMQFGRSVASAVLLSDCLPILRPFADLVKPRPDGTVPYIHIQEMFGETRFKSSSFLGLEVEDGRIYERWRSSAGSEYNRPSSLKSHIWGDKIRANVADYLRSQHFAVGLESHQFIAKES